MEEKHKDLKSVKQKSALNKIMASLNESHPSFYYLSTTEVAAEIKSYIDTPGKVAHADLQLVKDLSQHDIQILLSLHGQ